MISSIDKAFVWGMGFHSTCINSADKTAISPITSNIGHIKMHHSFFRKLMWTILFLSIKNTYIPRHILPAQRRAREMPNAFKTPATPKMALPVIKDSAMSDIRHNKRLEIEIRLFGKVIMNISYDINLCLKLLNNFELWMREKTDDFLTKLQNEFMRCAIDFKTKAMKKNMSDGKNKISFRAFAPKDNPGLNLSKAIASLYISSQVLSHTGMSFDEKSHLWTEEEKNVFFISFGPSWANA